MHRFLSKIGSNADQLRFRLKTSQVPAVLLLIPIAMASKEDLVIRAKIAEQAERYDDMAEAMKSVTHMSKEKEEELNTEERNLLSVAYKNVVGSRRSAWRIISSIEHKSAGSENTNKVDLARSYRTLLEEELTQISDQVLVCYAILVAHRLLFVD